MINEAMDINNPITRSFSVQLASEYPGEYNLAQVCNIYDYIRNNWKYVNDPRGLEYFEKASITIQNGLSGDLFLLQIYLCKASRNQIHI